MQACRWALVASLFWVRVKLSCSHQTVAKPKLLAWTVSQLFQSARHRTFPQQTGFARCSKVPEMDGRRGQRATARKKGKAGQAGDAHLPTSASMGSDKRAPGKMIGDVVAKRALFLPLTNPLASLCSSARITLAISPAASLCILSAAAIQKPDSTCSPTSLELVACSKLPKHRLPYLDLPLPT
jgi:hypothetical protein